MTTDDAPPPSRTPQPVTAETRAQVAALHAEGLGRNEIARRIGVSGATVTNIARDLELSFDRSATALAVRARQIDLADERQSIKAMLLVRGREALEAMDAPALVYSFGGRDNTYSERLLDAPPVGDQRNLMTIAAIALQRFADLDRVDQGLTGTGEAVGMLERLRDGLTVAVESLGVAGTEHDPTITPDRRPAELLDDDGTA